LKEEISQENPEEKSPGEGRYKRDLGLQGKLKSKGRNAKKPASLSTVTAQKKNCNQGNAQGTGRRNGWRTETERRVSQLRVIIISDSRLQGRLIRSLANSGRETGGEARSLSETGAVIRPTHVIF